MRIAILCTLLSLDASAAESIRWEPFELPGGHTNLRAQLGRLTVPLRRARPEAGSAELAFVRLQSGAGSARPPIVYLAGGPGSPAIGAARSPYALPSLARLAKVADVILLDQRGVGMSTPRPQCRPPKPLEPQERFVDAETSLARFLAQTRACVGEWTAKGVDIGAFNNRESAADVDDLRRALGAPKVSLLGFSYGTHLALAILRDHGAHVERAVLIGTAGPNHPRKLPLMLDTQLDKLSLLAKTDMGALLRRVLAKLEREPIRVTVTDRLLNKDVEVAIGPDALLRNILVPDIGDGNDFPFFPALLLTIERGDPLLLSWFAEKRYNQVGGVDLMALAMRCSSGATANRDREIALQAQASLFRNAVNAPYPDVCAMLPPVDLGDAFRAPIVSNVPVLFISGTLDSNTPPYQAEEVRWGMPFATHLIVRNAGHEDLEPNAEVQAIIADYFAGNDVSARHVSLPAPSFRSLDEAKKERKR